MRLDPETGRAAPWGRMEALSRRSGLAVIDGRIVYARAGQPQADLVALTIPR
jgi:hypothetical protein